LKTTNESEKSEILKPFCLFFFALACERIFIKTYSIESRYVIGLETILFVRASMHLFQPGNFTGSGSEGVNTDFFKEVLSVELVHFVFTDSLAR